MDEDKFAADFLVANMDKIFEIGRGAYKTVNEKVQIKLKTAYKEYLSTTRERYSQSKSFFIRNQAVDLYSYYVPIGIACDSVEFLDPSVESCLDFSNRLIITGTGGSGKSILMKHFFLECIRSKSFVPILIELRDLNNQKTTLDHIIEENLRLNKFEINGTYIERAKEAGHFCFLFDGYDEVSSKTRKSIVLEIESLAKLYSKCPIIISSRPDDVFEGIESFDHFRILPLSRDSAINLVEKLPFDLGVKAKFILDLQGELFSRHQSFLSNPLLLSIMLLTYGDNAEIPSKLSVFYNQAFEALFHRHDAYKAGSYRRERLTDLDIQDFSRVFSLFSLQTYEKRLFKLPKTNCLHFIEKSRNALNMEFSADDYLTDLLHGACLLIEDGLEIAFSHRSFQEYFVALYISLADPKVQGSLIVRYWDRAQFDGVIELLFELNPELVERELFIPKLQAFFLGLGVKRKIGVTHTAKYILDTFCSINFEPEHTSLTYKDDAEKIPALLNFVYRASSVKCNYRMPTEVEYKKNNQQLRDKYCKKGKTKNTFETTNMSYKSPLLSDMIKNQGFFSNDFLQAIFLEFKRLERKHKNTEQTLEQLLQI